MDADTLEMLRRSLRHVLADTSERPLAERLDELGWAEVVAEDETLALATLFDLHGDTLSGTDALGPQLSTVLASSLGDPSLSSASVVLPFGVESSHALGVLTVAGVITSEPAPDVPLVVSVGGGPGVRVAILPQTAVHLLPLATTDPSMALVEVSGTVADADLRWLDSEAGVAAWTAMLARGRWLLSAELVGIALHVVRSAVQYTTDRVQYGRPICTFQALQHRLAGAHALVIGAGHLVDEASASGDPWQAMVAKALAGRAAEQACTEAQQCYGAIGFTWEHEFHLYLRRTYVLDSMLGGWRALEFEIGSDLQATGHVPQIGSL